MPLIAAILAVSSMLLTIVLHVVQRRSVRRSERIRVLDEVFDDVGFLLKYGLKKKGDETRAKQCQALLCIRHLRQSFRTQPYHTGVLSRRF